MSTPSSQKVALIVDDDEFIRKCIRLILQKVGFGILEAQNGVDALDVIQREADRSIDLIISDVRMPEMGGISLVRQVRKLLPRLPIILISGYTADQEMDPGCKLYECCTFLQKPFPPSALIDTVQKMLDLKQDLETRMADRRHGSGTMAWSGESGEKIGLELLVAIQTARDEYRNAMAEGARMLDLAQAAGLATSDGGLAIHRSATANAAALRAISKYQEAWRQLTAFLGGRHSDLWC